MHVTINAISAKKGGSVTYLQNILPELLRRLPYDDGHRLVVWSGSASAIQADSRFEIRHKPDVSERAGLRGLGSRLSFDQIELPQLLKREHADVLFSSQNFATLRAPCRQVLLVRNTIYFDEQYLARQPLKSRANLALQKELILQGVRLSDAVLFPSQAMFDLVAASLGRSSSSWHVAHYGIRHERFFPLNEIRRSPATFNVLNVGLYSDQKNFGTLFRAMRMLLQQDPKRFHLTITAQMGLKYDPVQFPNLDTERLLFSALSRAGAAVDAQFRTHSSLPDLYRSADIFVFPSYTESFGHPTVEAMATGLPIVAADVPVHRELCGDAAVYFKPFDAGALADAIREVASDENLRQELRDKALKRSKLFRWDNHADELVRAFTGLSGP